MPQEQTENRIETNMVWNGEERGETTSQNHTPENQPSETDSLSIDKVLAEGPKNSEEVLHLVENISYEELRHSRLKEKYGEGFIGRFSAFLAGEVDSERVEAKDAKKTWWEKDIIREVLVSVFNRKNLYATGAAVAMGVLTGGLGAPVIGILLGSSAGRFGAELFANKEEKDARQKLMDAERDHWSRLKELAEDYRQSNAEAKKSKLEILLNEYFLNNETSVTRTKFFKTGEDFTATRKRWDKTRNICQSLGGVAGLGGGILLGQTSRVIEALPSLGAATLLGNNLFDTSRLDSYPLAYCNAGWLKMREKFNEKYRGTLESREAQAQTPAPPIVTKEMTLGDKKALSRKFAMVTLRRIRSYIDLLNKDAATTMAESDAIFNQKTRELVKDIVVHGMPGRDRETGRRILNNYPDNDGDGVLFLLAKAGFDISAVKFVDQGQFEEGKVNFDTGNKHGLVIEGIDRVNPYGKTAFLDHHGDETWTDLSATEVTYETLIASGLLERTTELDKYVSFITHIDNLTYPEAGRYFQNSHRMVLGLYRAIKAEPLYEFFARGGDPTHELTDEEIKAIGGQALLGQSEKVKRKNSASLRNISEAEADGFAIETPHGKTLIDLHGKIESVEAVFSKGYKIYVKWVPEQNRFNISGWPREKSLSQGRRIRNMWLKPYEDRGPLMIKLGEVIRILTNNQAAPMGKLRQYLEEELSGRTPHRSERQERGPRRSRSRYLGRGRRQFARRRAA